MPPKRVSDCKKYLRANGMKVTGRYKSPRKSSPRKSSPRKSSPRRRNFYNFGMTEKSNLQIHNLIESARKSSYKKKLTGRKEETYIIDYIWSRLEDKIKDYQYLSDSRKDIVEEKIIDYIVEKSFKD